MDRETRTRIEDFAITLRSILKIDGNIDDMSKVIRSLGGRVVKDGADYDSVARKIVSSRNSKFQFEINGTEAASDRASNDKKRRKRNREWTLAQSLGFVFFHMGYMISDDIWEKQPENTWQNIYGKKDKNLVFKMNHFAGAFLMPKTDFLEQVEKNTNADNKVALEPIAEHFNTTVSMVDVRGRDLGVFSFL